MYYSVQITRNYTFLDSKIKIDNLTIQIGMNYCEIKLEIWICEPCNSPVFDPFWRSGTDVKRQKITPSWGSDRKEKRLSKIYLHKIPDNALLYKYFITYFQVIFSLFSHKRFFTWLIASWLISFKISLHPLLSSSSIRFDVPTPGRKIVESSQLGIFH